MNSHPRASYRAKQSLRIVVLLGCLFCPLAAASPGPQEPEPDEAAETKAQDQAPTGVKARLKSMLTREPDEEESDREQESGDESGKGSWLAGPDLEGVLITTLEDVGRPYEIVSTIPAIAYREFGGASGRRPLGGLADPVVVSIDRAIKGLGSMAKERGADAVLGVKIEFQGQSGSEEGRVIVYGTLVKWVTKTGA